MKTVVAALGGILIGLSAMSCTLVTNTVQGNGQIASKTILVDQIFTSITTTGTFGISILESNYPRVEVTTDSNIQPHLLFSFSGNNLTVSQVENTVLLPSVCSIVVYTPITTQIVATGTGDITATGLTAASTLALRASGTGNISVSGATKTLSVTASGTGNISAGNLVASNVSVDMSGTGNVRVYATGSVTGSMSGTGILYYHAPTLAILRTGIGAIIGY